MDPISSHYMLIPSHLHADFYGVLPFFASIPANFLLRMLETLCGPLVDEDLMRATRVGCSARLLPARHEAVEDLCAHLGAFRSIVHPHVAVDARREVAVGHLAEEGSLAPPGVVQLIRVALGSTCETRQMALRGSANPLAKTRKP